MATKTKNLTFSNYFSRHSLHVSILLFYCNNCKTKARLEITKRWRSVDLWVIWHWKSSLHLLRSLTRYRSWFSQRWEILPLLFPSSSFSQHFISSLRWNSQSDFLLFPLNLLITLIFCYAASSVSWEREKRRMRGGKSQGVRDGKQSRVRSEKGK